MNISKLESGSYRVRMTLDGKVRSATFKTYPTQKEINQAFGIEQKKKTKKETVSETFDDCARKYIDLKDSVLSVTTIKNYESILKNISDEFKALPINRIKNEHIQKEINIYSATHSAKSTNNLSGFISPVLKMFRPSLQIYITLPQKTKFEPYMPSEKDVKRIMDYIYQNAPQYYVPYFLAMMGLRRSELLGIVLPDDLDGNILSINRTLVQDKNGQWLMKQKTKTTKSKRKIFIPDELRDLMLKQGYVYTGHPGNLTKYLELTQDKLEIPRFSLHILRHYYISLAHSMGVPDVIIANSVGHSDIQTTRNVYTHAFPAQELECQQYVAQNLTKVLTRV